MLAVLVLNYNDSETTIKFTRQIIDYKSVDKIIIIDNDSTDGSFDKIKKTFIKYPNIDVISSGSNLGYASGNNFGAQYALEHYNPSLICISNPDIVVSDASILKMKSFILENENVGQVSGIVKNAKGEIVKNFAWKLPSYTDFIFSFSLISKIKQNSYLKKIKSSQVIMNKQSAIKVDVILGCFFLLKSEVFEKIGYFDSQTFLYGEENILAYKIKKNGYVNYILPSEEIIHFHGTSIGKNIKSYFQKDKFQSQSREIYLRSYLNISEMGITMYKIFLFVQKIERAFIYFIKKVFTC